MPWRMDESYVKVKGLYRAVDKFGDIVDLNAMKQAMDNNGFTKKVVIDKSWCQLCGSGKH
jgi:transposase-like protein